MSTPQPPRRRRIAGESKPGAAAPKPTVKKAAKRRPQKPAAPQPTTPRAPTQRATTRKAEPQQVQAPTPAPAPAQQTAAPESASTAVEPRRRRLTRPNISGRFGALVALTVAAVAFGLVFGIRGFSDWRDGNAVVEAHEQAAATAAESGETIFTYQYNQLGQHLREAKKTMTPAFAKKFTEIEPALQNLAPQRKIQVKATVRNAAAIECGDKCSPDAATILVFIDQARVADGAKKPTVFGNRIELNMVERDGRWLVNNIKAL